jgi:hypothetical protein
MAGFWSDLVPLNLRNGDENYLIEKDGGIMEKTLVD